MTISLDRNDMHVSSEVTARGLAAISDRWVPPGVWQCYASGYWGADCGLVARTPSTIEMRFDHATSPLIEATELRDGRVRVRIQTRAPHQCVEALGTMWRAGDKVHFVDDYANRTADLSKMRDGRLLLCLHQPNLPAQEFCLTL